METDEITLSADNISQEHISWSPVRLSCSRCMSLFTTYKFLFSISELLQLNPGVITLLNTPKDFGHQVPDQTWNASKNHLKMGWKQSTLLASSSHCGWNQITSVYTEYIVSAVSTCIHLTINVRNQKVRLNIISEVHLSQRLFISLPPQLSTCLKPEKKIPMITPLSFSTTSPPGRYSNQDSCKDTIF